LPQARHLGADVLPLEEAEEGVEERRGEERRGSSLYFVLLALDARSGLPMLSTK